MKIPRVSQSLVALKKERFNHIRSPIPFHKQQDRGPFFETNQTSDERFSYIPPATDLRFRR
jgi:hypothetical protein